MSTRPDIEIALDVRSYERVIVITGQDSTHQYPDGWIRPDKHTDLELNEESVVVVDRVELQRKTMSQIAEAKPRLVAFAVASIDHEKQVRRMITSLYPWNEVWTIFTSFGKLLITKDAKGPSYDRDEVVDVCGPAGQA